MWRSQPGTMINARYRVLQEAGRGSFACVVRCDDKHAGGQVAVKMLERQYARDAAREVEVLRAVCRHDPDDRHPVVKMRAQFSWEGQPCIVFTCHGPSLRQRRLGGGDKGQLARLARGVAAALQYLHTTCRVVHTDLKPENILLERAEPAGAGLGSKWVICDLGSASFYTERPDAELITTRPYRAVEVLLCSGWTWPADNFSLGCILYEAHTGTPLFECARYCDSDDQHLQAMERRLGALPRWLSDAATGRGRGLVHGLARFRGNIGPSPFAAADRSAAPLSDRLNNDAELTDLITRLLDYCPYQRLRSDEVSHHPFCVAHCGKPSGGLVERYPSSALSAGRLPATPGSRARAAPDRLREKLPADAPRPGRSMSARPGMKGRGDALRDVTNRLPAQQLQKRDAADAQPQTGRPHHRPSAACGGDGWHRPRSGSVAAGARGTSATHVPPRHNAVVDPWRRPAAGAYVARAPW